MVGCFKLSVNELTVMQNWMLSNRRLHMHLTVPHVIALNATEVRLAKVKNKQRSKY